MTKVILRLIANVLIVIGVGFAALAVGASLPADPSQSVGFMLAIGAMMLTSGILLRRA